MTQLRERVAELRSVALCLVRRLPGRGALDEETLLRALPFSLREVALTREAMAAIGARQAVAEAEQGAASRGESSGGGHDNVQAEQLVERLQ